LQVENYHKENSINSFVFESKSKLLCNLSLYTAIIGVFIVVAVILTRLILKPSSPQNNIGLAVISPLWTFVSLTVAILISFGLSQTCSQFEKSNKSCGAVFGEGFFEGDTRHVYYKSLPLIKVAIFASYLLVVLWAAYCGFELYYYRNSSSDESLVADNDAWKAVIEKETDENNATVKEAV
jgi:hypothetical protein